MRNHWLIIIHSNQKIAITTLISYLFMLSSCSFNKLKLIYQGNIWTRKLVCEIQLVFLKYLKHLIVLFVCNFCHFYCQYRNTYSNWQPTSGQSITYFTFNLSWFFIIFNVNENWDLKTLSHIQTYSNYVYFVC